MNEDMWKRATIYGLKENIQMKNKNKLMGKANSNNRIWKTANDKDIELLIFGLTTFNPCIQLSCDDNNANFDALHELIRYCNKQAIRWKFPTHQSKWANDNNCNDIPYPYLSKFKLILQNYPKIDINDSCNEHRQTPLHLTINHQYCDIARYCIEQGVYIDIKEGANPFESIMEYIMKHKKNKNTKEYLDAMEICKWILKQRTMYPMKRIEYAIDYVKDKLIDKDGVIRNNDEESYETLLKEGATPLLGVVRNN
ncbi:hypothetical protein RFI_22192 [Reticulomyxa filosa]|uniref:Ankyrin repeat protein n=1 Tax=Reticulomyxa filosa TaxID=46433 RepID=X6MP04_RETFI|nr:hypothetical protein RFI_22192 [Reticulomyxa filosa]|eukprot:ETO15172.1 hypothetical protein RFI_22192 [Reticulomyxa filosa]